MTTPTLVITGEKDINRYLTVRGADWQTDSYHLSPSPKSLLTVFNGEHILGGVSGYDAKETTDENPERVAFILQFANAYLRSVLYSENQNLEMAEKSLEENANPLGKIEFK